MVLGEENPVYSPFFGVMGAAAAIIFSGKCPFRKKSGFARREKKNVRDDGGHVALCGCVCVFVRDCDTVQGCNLFPVRSCDSSGHLDERIGIDSWSLLARRNPYKFRDRIAWVEISAPKKIAYFSTRLTREHESVFVTSLPSVSVFVTHTETSGGDRRACC